MTNSPNNNNPGNGDSGDGRDPLEDFLKKMQESGFDPSDNNNPLGASSLNPEDLKNMGLPFDPSMMQGILEQMNTMFSINATPGSTPEQGVNWTGVKDQARRMIAADSDPSIAENLKQATADAAHLADLWLDSVTVFERHNIPVEAWSKAEWLDASFNSWREMVEPVAAEVTQAMVLPGADNVPEELTQEFLASRRGTPDTAEDDTHEPEQPMELIEETKQTLTVIRQKIAVRLRRDS